MHVYRHKPTKQAANLNVIHVPYMLSRGGGELEGEGAKYRAES